jgi:uncharacterized protein (DUF427 family)
MMLDPVKENHPITVEANRKHVTVKFAGEVIAETDRAVVMREANYPPVVYVPREDAKMQMFERTAHSTHCPFKGDASYFSLVVDGKRAENAAWSYEQPYPPAAPVRDYLAFYPDSVTTEQE